MGALLDQCISLPLRYTGLLHLLAGATNIIHLIGGEFLLLLSYRYFNIFSSPHLSFWFSTSFTLEGGEKNILIIRGMMSININIHEIS